MERKEGRGRMEAGREEEKIIERGKRSYHHFK